MYDAAVQNLIDELGRLPGVGPKSAQRIAFYILNAESSEMEKLTHAISTVKKTVSFCEVCGNISETKLCAICRDDRRDPEAICVVEESKDVVAIERTRSFNGRYHVLGGAINPLAGLGPEQLRIRELVARLSDERVQEIILAMDPNLEGEATSTYISRLLVPLGIRVSRLASGLPVGGDLEYADEITLGRALEGRRVISEGNRTETVNAAEEFEQAVEEEAAETAEVEASIPQTPKKRWSGSMFDDIDSSAPTAEQVAQLSDFGGSSGSAQGHSSAQGKDERADTSTDSPGSVGEGEQGSLNEALLEQTLENLPSENLPAKEGTADEASASATTGTDQSRATIPGDLSAEEREARTRETQESESSDPADSEAADHERAARRASYEEKLEELKKTPLRTPKPDIPPVPGKTYVNPWT